MKKLLRVTALLLAIIMIVSTLSSCSGLPSINLSDLITLSTGEVQSSSVVVEGTGVGVTDRDTASPDETETEVEIEIETDIETETVIYVNGEEFTNGEEWTSEVIGGDTFAEETPVIIPESYPWWGAEYIVLSGFEYDVDGEYSPNYEISSAICKRNERMMRQYGLNVFGDFTDDVYFVARQRILAGDTNFDLVVADATDMLKLTVEGHLADINSLDYVDLDQSCWDENANSHLSLGDRLYYTTNKFLLYEKMHTNVLWYNRELAEELRVGDIEQEVLDGTWTFERFLQVTREASGDMDGRPDMTVRDRWGHVTKNVNGLTPLLYGSDFLITEKDENGLLGFAALDDKMLTAVNNLKSFYEETNVSFVSSTDVNNEEESRYASEIFEDGRALFFNNDLTYERDILSFESGVIPMPKYSPDQESYASITTFAEARFLGVPVSVVDTEKASFGLQALSELSENTSYSAFVSLINIKNDRIVDVCLDEILNNRVWDILAIRGLGAVFSSVRKEIIGNNVEPFEFEYERRSENAKRQIDELNNGIGALN